MALKLTGSSSNIKKITDIFTINRKFNQFDYFKYESSLNTIIKSKGSVAIQRRLLRIKKAPKRLI